MGPDETHAVVAQEILAPMNWSRWDGRYGVYAIWLKADAIPQRERQSRSTKRKRAVYVGQSALTPPARFRQHRKGIHASRWVRQYGIKLAPGLYGRLPRYWSRGAAEYAERKLAQDLRRRGYYVRQG